MRGGYLPLKQHELGGANVAFWPSGHNSLVGKTRGDISSTDTVRCSALMRYVSERIGNPNRGERPRHFRP